MSIDPANQKPTRSEIEDAVGGNKRAQRSSTPAKPDTAPDDLQLESSNGRRQQVIGGDLTGISRRGSRPNWLAKVSEVNYINLIAVGIVLAILAVFFWPTENSNAVREIATDAGPEVTGYQGVERTDEPELPISNEAGFGRDDDLQRATEFRLEDTQQRQITLLLQAAQKHISAGEYSQPPGNNAVSRYQQVLQIDSRNRPAREGLEFVRGRFLSNGLDSLNNGDARAAEVSLSKINAIDADSEEALELNSSIQAWRVQQQIDELLAQAEAARNADQLILPARANALFFYQQVAELESDNSAAKEGISAIADAFVNKANAAVMAGELQAATGYLATVSVIDPQHQSVPLIESMIANAKPIAGRASAATDTPSQRPINRPPSREKSEPVATTLPRRPREVSNNRTPTNVAKEREAFDRRYLERGLEAYYKGNYEQAIGLLQPLADKGIARAQFRIGYMHYLGRGFDRDRTIADEVIRAALPAVQKFADEGRGWAQSDIGSLYEDGLVLPRDYAEAIYWYRSAAEQGYPGAQTNLGVMYARGLGVSSSRKTAVEWFQRAAKQGDIAAKRNLESMGIKP